MFSVLDIFFWPGVFIFVPTVLMGASFPLISYLGLTRQDQEGKTVGTVYFFNVAGNLLGGIVTGFILLPLIGSELSLLFFSLIGITFILFKGNAFIPKNIVLVLVCCVFSICFLPALRQNFTGQYIPRQGRTIALILRKVLMGLL